jgi:hypothetical protein
MAFRRKAVAAAVVAAGTLAAGAAAALPSWSYHWSDISSQQNCMSRAWEVVTLYEVRGRHSFRVDHTTESVIELEFAADDAVATLLCTNRTFVLHVFGSDYQVTQDIRDGLANVFEGKR